MGAMLCRLRNLLLGLLTGVLPAVVAARDGFPLVRNGRSAPVCCPGGEEAVVRTALAIYAADAERVTGSPLESRRSVADGTVVVGTLSGRGGLDSLAEAWGVPTADLAGRWEAFRLCEAVRNGQRVLFVVGSDPRGTAYGVLELSRLLGVSPWEWWADVTPRPLRDLTLPADYDRSEAPSVRYRGIFLNDEDWGLDPWGTRYEGSDVAGELGPKTYSRIFELLLRLRANTIWPAMHASTVAFYRVPGNREAAERYGIVVGTSHCEPMMRNNVGEWDETRFGAYDFASNRTGVLRYWRDRVREVARDENIFTLGMRGVHDGEMAGAETLDEQTALTNEVIRAQRRMLAEELHRPVTVIPQIFVPYKEVLDIYNNGVEVPDDVTLMWCDDNYGYITRLSNAAERTRNGGAGVYYHVSYYGKPHDYLWLTTSQPALMVAEMQRAWEYGARKIWILNVGDLKPAEYHTELFLDMAWRIDAVTTETVGAHRQRWLAREFGEEVASEAFALLQEHYRLAAERKPEHMGWSRIQQPGVKGGITPVADTEFDSFGREGFARLEAYGRLQAAVRRLAERLPADRQDAWFELVRYPVEGAALMNKKWLCAQYARRYAAEGLAAGAEYAAASRQAYDSIRLLTDRYNRETAGGKWRDMMSMTPRNLPVFAAPAFGEFPMETRSLLWVEGAAAPVSSDMVRLPRFVRSAGNEVAIHLFSSSDAAIGSMPTWIDMERVRMTPSHERLVLRADFSRKARSGDSFTIHLGERTCRFVVECEDDSGMPGVPMVAGVAAVAGAGYDRADGAVCIEGLGQSGRVVHLEKGCRAEYLLRSDRTGATSVIICFLPQHPAVSKTLRFRLTVDGEERGVFDIRETFGEEPWKVNVLRNQARCSLRTDLAAGLHRIGIEPLDEAMILDGVALDRTERTPYVFDGFTR